MATLHTFDFLAESINELSPVCVAFGDESFLKRLVMAQLRSSILGDEDDDVPFASFEGKSAEWRDVVDELATVSLFGGGRPRLVIVEQADDFVSKHRTQLEDYVASPRKSGVLVLDVGTWAGNTRLYKAVDKGGLQIECRPPEASRGKRKYLDENRVRKWIVDWGKSQYSVSVTSQAAELLLELEGPEFGMLDQDLAKLSLFAGDGGKVTPELVRDEVGGWRTQTTWDLIDAAADGDAGGALLQLERLLQAGEHPVALFGQIAWSLRRFAAAVRIFEQAEQNGERVNIRTALETAGFRKWPQEAMDNAERQLKQLGRDRSGQIYRWLLDADLALKGSHSQPDRARYVLEKLFLKMSRELSPQQKRAAS